MTDTATIRVPVEVRDRLQLVASERGVSLAKLIAEFASREHLHLIYEQEREAWRKDLENPEVLAELELWDSTFDDFD